MRRRNTRWIHSLIVTLVVFALVTLLVALNSLPAGRTLAQTGSTRSSSFNYVNTFGMIPGQAVRFCVGTGTARGPALDWTIRISGERGDLLFQVLTTHSPAGEWHCRDVPRNSLPVAGEAGTGRAELSALLTVLAPNGTSAAGIVASFSVIEPDGSTAYLELKLQNTLISSYSL